MESQVLTTMTRDTLCMDCNDKAGYIVVWGMPDNTTIKHKMCAEHAAEQVAEDKAIRVERIGDE